MSSVPLNHITGRVCLILTDISKYYRYISKCGDGGGSEQMFSSQLIIGGNAWSPHDNDLYVQCLCVYKNLGRPNHHTGMKTRVHQLVWFREWVWG